MRPYHTVFLAFISRFSQGRTDRPESLTRAMTFAWAGFAIGFTGSWLAWLLDYLTYAEMVVSSFMYLAYGALVWRMDQGGPLARHGFAFLSVLGLLSVPGLFRLDPESLAGWVVLVLDLAALFYLYCKPSREWYAARAARLEQGFSDD